MGFWRGLGRFAVDATILTGNGTVGAAKIAGKGARVAGKAVYDHRKQISEVASTTVKAAGTTVALVGYGGYKATAWTTRQIVDHRREIGGAAVGLVKGFGNASADATAHAYAREEVLKTLVELIKYQSAEYQRLVAQSHERLSTTPSTVRRRDVVLDTLVVGGNTLASYGDFLVPVPPDVEQAYQTAYPDLAAHRSFVEEVRHLDASQMTGFVSGVKGKLFEMEYVNHLNDGQLPSGYHAMLAHSATQPGWDIEILGPDGHTKDIIQAKATESVAYVKDALNHYPNIDVVTTDEVYSHLAMTGFGDHVTTSGITEHALHSAVSRAVDGAAMHLHWTPSVISLALIAFSAYSKEGLDAYEKSKNFGERSARSYLAYLAGGAVSMATGTWWIGTIGAIGSRLVLGRGSAKRERLRMLKELVRTNERVLTRLRGRAT